MKKKFLSLVMSTLFLISCSTQKISISYIEAEFPGGTQAFIRKIQENFDSEAVDGEGILKTEVRFVVEIDGTVSDVRATGTNASFNREAERAIRSIKGWKPSEKITHKKNKIIKIEKARSRHIVPITMRFE